MSDSNDKKLAEIKESIKKRIEHKKEKIKDKKLKQEDFFEDFFTLHQGSFKKAFSKKDVPDFVTDLKGTMRKFPNDTIKLLLSAKKEFKPKEQNDILNNLITDFTRQVKPIVDTFTSMTNDISTAKEAEQYTRYMFQAFCKEELLKLGIKDYAALLEKINDKENTVIQEKMKTLQETVTGKHSVLVPIPNLLNESKYHDTPEYKKLKAGNIGEFTIQLVSTLPSNDVITKNKKTIYIKDIGDSGNLQYAMWDMMWKPDPNNPDSTQIRNGSISKGPNLENEINLFKEKRGEKSLEGSLTEEEDGLKTAILKKFQYLAKSPLPETDGLDTVQECFAFTAFVDRFEEITDEEIRAQWALYNLNGDKAINISFDLNDKINIEINKAVIDRNNLKPLLESARDETNKLVILLNSMRELKEVSLFLPIPTTYPTLGTKSAAGLAKTSGATVEKNSKTPAAGTTKANFNYEEIHAAAKKIWVDDTTEFMKEYMEFSDLINNNQNNKNNDVIQKKCAELLTKVAPKDPKEVHFNLTNKKRRNELITQLEKSPPETGALLKALSEVYISDLRPSLLSDKTRKLPDSIENFVQIVNDKITKDATLFSSANLSTPSSAAQSSTVPTTTIFPTTQQPIGITPQSAAANLESEQAAALIPPPPATVTFSVPKRTHQRSASMPNIIVPGSKAEKLLVGRRNSVGGETEVPNKAKKLLGDTPPAGTTDKARKFFGIEAPTSSPLKTLIDPSISLDKLPEDRPRGKKP